MIRESQELVVYFQEQLGLRRLMIGLAERFLAHGTFKGTVTLEHISVEEARALNAWFRVMSYQAGDSVRITAQKFLAALGCTRWSGCDLRSVLENLLQRDLRPKKDVQAEVETKRQDVVRHLYALSTSQEWFDLVSGIEARSPELLAFQRCFNEDSLAFLRDMQDLALLLAHLPKQDELLPVFANRILSDPHALDSNRTLGRLLATSLRYRSRSQEQWDDLRAGAEYRTLKRFHLIRDDVLNLVSCFGLILQSASTSAKHWTALAYEQRSFVNVSLEELNVMESAAASGGGPILIVENSGVFSQLVKDLREACAQGYSFTGALICFHGQLKQASWRILDLLLAKSPLASALSYSGDMDLEGLRIADRIHAETAGQIQILHMNRTAYQRHLMSQKTVAMDPQPEKTWSHPELRELAQCIRENQKYVYQEALLSEYRCTLGLELESAASS